jgi:hypothetical protein
MRKALVAVLFGTLCAALPAQDSSIPGPTGDRYAYSIQYVPKNDFYKMAVRKKSVESYDSISRYLQERLSREIEARGFHLAGTADSAAFKFTIDLMKVSDNQGAGNMFNPLNVGPIVTVQAAISIADSAGTLIYRKEFVGKAKLATPGGSERAVTMAGRAADDLVLKLDNDKDFKKVLYVPSGVMASSPVPAAPSSQEAASAQAAESAHAIAPTPFVPPSHATTAPAQPRLVQLPVGTAVTLTLDQDFDPDRANEGDIISFTLAEDLRVGAETVASVGVKAKGSFYREALSKGRRFLLGGAGGGVTSSMPAGDPHIRMGYIEIGDLRVNLRSEQPQSKEQSLAPGAEILGSVRKNRRIGWVYHVDQGTRFRAYTAENVNLPSVAPAVQSDQQTEIAPAKTAATTTARLGDVFVVTDQRDLNFLRIAEGAKMSNTTLPSGKVVPAPPEGMVWRVRKGAIVLEQDK